MKTELTFCLGKAICFISHRAFHVSLGQGVLITDDEIRRLVEFRFRAKPTRFRHGDA